MIRLSTKSSSFGNNNGQEQILVAVRCTNANQAIVLQEKIIKRKKSAKSHRKIMHGIESWCQSGIGAS